LSKYFLFIKTKNLLLYSKFDNKYLYLINNIKALNVINLKKIDIYIYI